MEERSTPDRLCWTVFAAVIVLMRIAPAVAEQSPNFVVILTDDQGWSSTSVSMIPDGDLASDYHRTPNLRRLAEEGMRFSQGYAPAGLCCPTRRSLQFGQTPLRQGDDAQFAVRYPTHGDQLTIPKLLKLRNPRYRAAHFGKWDLRRSEERGTTPLAPEHLGYDESDGNTDNGIGSEGDDGSPDPIAKDQKWSRHAVLKDPKRIFSLTDRGCDFVKRMTAAGRPFYLQLSHYAVHADFQVQAETLAAVKKRPAGMIHANAPFAAMTEDLDAGVGRLLECLDRLEISEVTYVFYLSDNGGVPWIPPNKEKLLSQQGQVDDAGRNYPLRSGKWTVFEGGIRVPFVVRGPGIAANSVSHVPVVGWDLLPTIGDLAGYEGPLPSNLDGGSFRALLQNGGNGSVHRPVRGLVFHRYSNSYPHSAIRLGDYKLIRFWKQLNGIPPIQLFDLTQDVGETENLAAKMPQKARELEMLLRQYAEEVNSSVVPQAASRH